MGFHFYMLWIHRYNVYFTSDNLRQSLLPNANLVKDLVYRTLPDKFGDFIIYSENFRT